MGQIGLITNWNTNAPVDTWFGVTVDNGHVTEINLVENKLVGTIPPEIGNLTHLTWLDIYYCRGITGSLPKEIGQLTNLEDLTLVGNRLSGNIPASITNLTKLSYLNLGDNYFSGKIPDLTQLPLLNDLILYYNNFDFGDFENEFITYKNTIPNFYYSPMRNLDSEISYDLVIGNNYSMTMNDNGTGVTYQWYKNDVAISGATSKTYTINNIQISDAADYTCKASSPIITDLTINRSIIHVYGSISSNDKNALIDLYNATSGDYWINNTNWNTSAPVHDWYGIKVRGTRVVELNLTGNHLLNNIPSSIGNLTEVTLINLSYNDLYELLDVSQNIALINLYCNNNQLSPLDVSQNTSLTQLNCKINNLNSLDVSQNTALTYLNCGYTDLIRCKPKYRFNYFGSW